MWFLRWKLKLGEVDYFFQASVSLMGGFWNYI